MKAQIKLLDPVCQKRLLVPLLPHTFNGEKTERSTVCLLWFRSAATQVKDFVKVSKVQRQMIKREKSLSALSAEHGHIVSRLASLASDHV